MRRINILLDCDPGHDDAIALMVAGAFKCINLVGISVVSGNQTVDKTFKNAFNVTHYLDIDVPICKGSEKPLKRDKLNCSEIHGESGLDGFDFPPYEYTSDQRDIEDFIFDKCKENCPCVVVITGPMTNIAKALLKYPSLKDYISQIVVMGGAMREGNISKYAEFNILADAEAADIIIRSQIPMRMVTLDVTRQVMVLPNIVERMDSLNTRGSKLFVALMRFFNQSQKDFFGLDGGPLHDPTTIVSLLNKDVITFEKMNVQVDVSNTDHYGQTVCTKNGDIEVSTSINKELFWDIIEKSLNYYK